MNMVAQRHGSTKVARSEQHRHSSTMHTRVTRSSPSSLETAHTHTHTRSRTVVAGLDGLGRDWEPQIVGRLA